MSSHRHRLGIRVQNFVTLSGERTCAHSASSSVVEGPLHSSRSPHETAGSFLNELTKYCRGAHLHFPCEPPGAVGVPVCPSYPMLQCKHDPTDNLSKHKRTIRDPFRDSGAVGNQARNTHRSHARGSRIVLEPVSEELVDRTRGLFSGKPSLSEELKRERRREKNKW